MDPPVPTSAGGNYGLGATMDDTTGNCEEPRVDSKGDLIDWSLSSSTVHGQLMVGITLSKEGLPPNQNY